LVLAVAPEKDSPGVDVEFVTLVVKSGFRFPELKVVTPPGGGFAQLALPVTVPPVAN
jgi:hypothetical protein